MNKALDELLQKPGIWRAGETTKDTGLDHVATGFAELDALLPGGGWPAGALTEMLHDQSGIGELRVLIPALARLSQAGRWIALIAPPHIPYAPALAAHGVNLSRILLVHPRKDKDALWALEQALRSGTCAAVIAWPGKVDNPGLRRLQLAAERGRTWGVLFRQAREAETASPAHLRFHLSKEDSALSLELLKCRGGKAHRRIRIDLTRADTPTPVPQEPRPAHGPRLAAPGCSPYRPSFPACAAPIGHTGHALSDLTDGPPASPAREAQRPSSRAGWVLPGTPREQHPLCSENFDLEQTIASDISFEISRQDCP